MGLKAHNSAIIIFLAITLLIFSSTVECAPNYIFSCVKTEFKNYVHSIFPLANDTFVLIFENKTLVLLKDLKTIGRVELPAKPLAHDYVNGKIYLLLENGLLITLSGIPLRIEKSLRVVVGDEKPEYLAISPRGNYGALAVKYKYQGTHDASRLIFFDLNSGERVFVRDAESTPMLVKLFYFRRVGEILILQTLDTFCELCEYTDNKIEAYNISSLKLLYSKEIGLSFIDVEEEKGLLVLVRALRESGKHKLIVLNMFNGAVKYESEVAERPSGILARGTNAFIVTTEQSIVVYKYTSGRKTGELYVGGGVTFSKMGRLTVVGSPYRIYVLTPSPNVLWKERAEYYGVPRPPMIACHGNSSLIIYGKKYAFYLKVHTASLLEILVVDRAGNPIPGAKVILTEQGRTVSSTITNNSGYALLVAKPYVRIKITVLKEGYITREVSLLPLNLKERVKVTLSKTKYTSKLTIIARHGNESVKDVLIYLKDPQTNIVESDATNSEGKCIFEDLAPGTYILEAKKPGFKTQVKNITLSERADIKLVLNLELELYNLTVKISGIETKYNLTVINEEGSIVWKGEVLANSSTYIGSLKPGLYRVSGEGLCGSNIVKIMLNEDTTFQLNIGSDIYCLKRRGVVIDTQELKEISDEICRYTMYCNKSMSIYLGDANFPSFNETGDMLELSRRDKVFVVAFFYTKCWGCERVVPLLEELEAKHPAVKAAMVSIYSTDTYDDIIKYIEEHNITVPVYRDAEGVHEKLGINVVPSVVAVYKGKVLVLGIGVKSEENIGIDKGLEQVVERLDLASLVDAMPMISTILGLILCIVACMIFLFSRRGEEV